MKIYLKKEIFVGIEIKKVKGYKGIQLLKRHVENEVEFTPIMWLDTIESVKQFAGENFENAYVPAKAREVLCRFDDKSVHCDVAHELNYQL